MKIIFIGTEKSGKTKVINRLVGNNYTYNDEPTIGWTYQCSDDLAIWEFGGNIHANFTLLEYYFPDTQKGVFFVDLSKEINDDEIQYLSEVIKKLKSASSTASIILVGTKCDLVQEPKQVLSNIQVRIMQTDSTIEFIACIAISAKENVGINELKQSISAHVTAMPTQELYSQAKSNFLDAIKHLPQINQNIINTALSLFEQNKNANVLIHTCQQQIQGNHPYLMKAALAFVTIALVIASVGIVGFGIGFAAGVWVGTGAFISAVLLGNPSAMTVAFVSASTGIAAGAYSLFHKDEKSSQALEKLHILGSLNC